MATIPNYSPVPFAPATTNGIFDVADAAPQQQQPLFARPRAAMPAEDAAWHETIRRAGSTGQASPYLAFERHARSLGLSARDAIGVSVAQAVAAMRAPAPQASIFSNDDDEVSPQARRDSTPSSGMPAPSGSRAAGVIG
jgi:hypothetical protein